MNFDHVLSERVNKLGQSATIKMAELARELKRQGNDVISLSLGEPDFDTPDHIKEAAKKALDEGYTKYTPVPGLLPLREAISQKFKRDNNLEYGVDQIVVSNGAKQTIANLCLSLLNEGDEVIIFTPYWVSYYEIVKFSSGTPITLAADIQADFKVNPAQLEEAITERTKMILFSSPCNPTGSVYTQEDLNTLAEVIAKHEKIVVVSDEIYEHINFTGKHASIGTHPLLKDRTVTINGMSKGFAMTGWRLGYMGAPQPIAKACAKIQGQFTSGATAFGQMAAAHAISTDLSPTFKMKEAYLRRKKMIAALLRDMPGIKTNDPQGAFYIFPDVSSYFGKSYGDIKIDNAEDFCMNLLQHGHVSLVSGAAFGDPNCARISYAASDDSLKEAMRRMKEFLSNFS